MAKMTGASESWPVVARDGSRVAYVVGEFQKAEIYVAPIYPGGQPGMAQRVCEGCGKPYDWSVDGRKVVYFARRGERVRVAVLDVASGERIEVLQSERDLFNARFSPDDRWILFNESLGAHGGRPRGAQVLTTFGIRGSRPPVPRCFGH